MRVLGTAGHVDHGKSTLVECLTGINPDRLKEEQERQMTIDLGFAWMDLPDGESVGIIDVPGHRDFIENMLAGVGGIDAALLVIAADEGVMPQTREHLAILDLLEIQECVVALTKVDLVEDAAWLDLVQDEVEELLKSTRFAGMRVIRVSAKEKTGIEELIEALGEALHTSVSKPDHGRPRLPIDRAFSIAGFGTVVTGTLIDGSLETGREVVVLPGEHKGRIRGLQTHRKELEAAVAGSRVAANVTSIEANRVERGDVVCLPGDYEPTRVLDASVRLLADAAGSIRHNQNVKVYIGAAQRMARIRLLGVEIIEAGKEGWIQIVMKEPVVAARGDRYILRRPSPGATLGGGRIADAHPERLYRRKDQDVIQRLEQLLRGSPEEVLMQVLKASGPMPLPKIVEKSGLDTASTKEGLERLVAKGEIVGLEERAIELGSSQWVIDRKGLDEWIDKLKAELDQYHLKFHLREGMPREELKSRAKLEAKPFALILESAVRKGEMIEDGTRIRNATHLPSPTDQEEKVIEELKKRFEAAQHAPPSEKETLEAVGEEIAAYLLNSGWLIKLSGGVVFESGVYQQMVNGIKKELKSKGTLTVAEVRDMFKTSRKYALALMEHLDEVGVTIREGDERRLA
jgi:selenocysteine-specific elongation factor